MRIQLPIWFLSRPRPPISHPYVTSGVLHFPSSGQTWTLLPGKNIVGRESAPDVAIVLPWPHVSRRHAQIEMLAQGSWEIEDLQSRNGVAVNGQKLQPRSLFPLLDGDRIQVGSAGGIELVFCFQPATLASPTTSYEEFLEEDEFR